MIAQWLLIVALGLIAAYAVSQWRAAPAVAAGIFATTLCGTVVVIFPDIATSTANAIGIGRGADLIMYVFIIVILAAILNIHIKIRSSHKQLTEIARTIALQTARPPDGRP